jgi:hypothetical protein
MIDHERKQCRDESRENIPWYVNGTLSEVDATAVRRHLEACSECRVDFEMHSETRDAVLGRELTPIMPMTTAADVIGVGADRVPGSLRNRQWPSRLSAIAAGIAIIGLALVLLPDAGDDGEVPNQVFETATSVGMVGGIDYVLALQFDEDVADIEREEIAMGLRGAVRWSVDDRGVYEVRVRLAEPTLQDLQEYEQRVGALNGVESAEFTALQLPMR